MGGEADGRAGGRADGRWNLPWKRISPYVGGPLPEGPMRYLIATATELTAQSIASAISSHTKTLASTTREVIASGGGVHNRWLMRRLRELLPALDVVTTADHGIDPDAKEAIAFAVLAHEFVSGRPGNLPSATGARRAALLGRETPGV